MPTTTRSLGNERSRRFQCRWKHWIDGDVLSSSSKLVSLAEKLSFGDEAGPHIHNVDTIVGGKHMKRGV
ncbi:hypothetical protein MRB53_013645 [Persea americana]|uniref:Uncharacterized protein n=1 Tax=Persea americana TaxID=3435 RepID=A0ACC2K918_PERAE|nr:hypothetical protein MRB53_013645 [Persea americana]